MNLPNKLTVGRICIIPVFMIFMLIPLPFPGNAELICRCVAAFFFLAAAITDHLDGKIARKYNLITDFGKFLDPLADKMMVLGAVIGLTVLAGKDPSTEGDVYFRLTAAFCFIVLFRELAVTSLRLAASGSKGVVIAANILGKVKTVTQIVFVMTALLEPVVLGELLGNVCGIGFFADVAAHHILSYITMGAASVMTVWSGLNYFKAYFPLINSNK